MYLALGLFSYLLLEHEIKHVQKNKKIRNNYLSFIHIVVCITAYILGYLTKQPVIFKSIMYANTGGFFINEIGFFYKEREYTKTNIALIIHHIISLIIINKVEFDSYIFFLLAGAEFTNIPGCILYHYIQKKKTLQLKEKEYEIPCGMLQKKIQAVIYIIMRVFVSPYFMYKVLTEEDNISINVLLIPIYLVGVVWSIKLYKTYNKPI